jgi:hypothetical protein
VLTATSEDGVDYTTEARTYSVADGVLTEIVPVGNGTLTTESPDFPELSQFNC